MARRDALWDLTPAFLFLLCCFSCSFASLAPSYPTKKSDAVSNEDDQWYPYQDSMGYDALMDTTWVNSANISDGVISSITVGLNMYVFRPPIPILILIFCPCLGRFI